MNKFQRLIVKIDMNAHLKCISHIRSRSCWLCRKNPADFEFLNSIIKVTDRCIPLPIHLEKHIWTVNWSAALRLCLYILFSLVGCDFESIILVVSLYHPVSHCRQSQTNQLAICLGCFLTSNHTQRILCY